VRTSYLPEEISWAERLHPLLTYERDNGRYVIDYSQFHRTTPVTMSDCSAAQWASNRHQFQAKNNKFSVTKQSKTDDEEDDDEEDDYSVSFTFHSPETVAATVSSPVWSLFNRNRQFRDNITGLDKSLRNGSQGSQSWSLKNEVTRRSTSIIGSESTYF